MMFVAEKPPTKSERKRCWDARDIFFQCLDKNSIVNPMTQNEKIKLVCLAEEENFKNSCIKSWMEYFQKKRVFDIQKELYKVNKIDI